MAKKSTELVLLFHKNITKLVFLWPNMGQRCFKVFSLVLIIFCMLQIEDDEVDPANTLLTYLREKCILLYYTILLFWIRTNPSAVFYLVSITFYKDSYIFNKLWFIIRESNSKFRNYKSNPLSIRLPNTSYFNFKNLANLI